MVLDISELIASSELHLLMLPVQTTLEMRLQSDRCANFASLELNRKCPDSGLRVKKRPEV